MAHIERIQDAAEAVLIESGHLEMARAYIAYREQHRLFAPIAAAWSMWADRSTNIRHEDWRVNANANQGLSGGLI